MGPTQANGLYDFTNYYFHQFFNGTFLYLLSYTLHTVLLEEKDKKDERVKIFEESPAKMKENLQEYL